MKRETREHRKANLRNRLADGQEEQTRCRIVGCGRATPAAHGAGLDRRYCRAHGEFHDRHGSYVCRSYPAASIGPHRMAALRWIDRNRDHRVVRLALRNVETLLATAGPSEEAHRLRGLSPQERARVALARLRVAKVAPEKLLASWLAVESVIQSDPQADHRAEFKRVQGAKLVHRLASGSHRRWTHETANGAVTVIEMHRYPASRGQVLRHLGARLEKASELVIDLWLAAASGGR